VIVVVVQIIAAWLMAGVVFLAAFNFTKWRHAPKADTSTAQRMFEVEEMLRSLNAPCPLCGARWELIDETMSMSDVNDDGYSIRTRSEYRIAHEVDCEYGRWAQL
jgi:hypothetical protein